MRLIGVLLAAGRGSRLNGNKQFHVVLTSDGEKPLVAAAFDTIAHACDEMFVVLGHRADEVAAILSPREFETVVADPDAPMIDSVHTGFRRIATQLTADENFAILLQLGDHPALERATLDHLLAATQQHPGKAVIPTHEGNGGHPVLIPAKIAEQILASPCPDGLRGYWLAHPEQCLRIEVADSGIVRNINSC